MVDRDAARLDQVAARFPARRRSTERSTRCCADADIDAVVIATPTSTHYALVKAALDAGKHVLVEKPITTRVDRRDELSALAERQGRILMVGHVFLFNPAVRRVKRVPRARATSGASTTSRWCAPTSGRSAWTSTPPGISRRTTSRSPTTGWAASRPTVSAVGGTWINRGIEDAVFATLRYPSDVLVNLHASWLNPRKARDITVVGDRRMLTFDDMNLLRADPDLRQAGDRRRTSAGLRRHLRVASAPACARATSPSPRSPAASRSRRSAITSSSACATRQAPARRRPRGGAGRARARGHRPVDAQRAASEENGR